jgi:death-on-curing protein
MIAEPVWLQLEFVRRMHARQLAEHGGIPGLRDEGMLLSALNRPLDKWSYSDPRPDLCELAAAYAYGLAKNHPFLDGNKRSSAVACETFLVRNGLMPTATEEEKYPVYLALASGEMDEDTFAGWLRQHTAPVP